MAYRRIARAFRPLASALQTQPTLALAIRPPAASPARSWSRRWQSQTVPGTEGEVPTAPPPAEAGVRVNEEAIVKADAASASGSTAAPAAPPPSGLADDPFDSESGDAARRYVPPPANRVASEEVPDVFIGRLPFRFTSKMLKDSFQDVGEVLNARVITDRDGASRGFGYLKFRTLEEAQKAAALDGQRMLDGRPIRLDISKGLVARQVGRGLYGGAPAAPSMGHIAPSTVVYLGNLTYDLQEREIAERFPLAKSIRIPVLDTGRGRGFCYVEFHDLESAQAFVEDAQTNGFIHSGRAIRVGYAATARRNADGSLSAMSGKVWRKKPT